MMRGILAVLLLCFGMNTGAQAGFVPQLASKVDEIKSACGSKVISGVRHTLIAGTNHLSLHASGRAADLKGNPRCIYMHLKGWTKRGGGYSIDYSAVRHVHVSFGGREAGVTFRHGSGSHHRRHVQWSFAGPSW